MTKELKSQIIDYTLSVVNACKENNSKVNVRLLAENLLQKFPSVIVGIKGYAEVKMKIYALIVGRVSEFTVTIPLEN